ncbi:hypothetical protein SESBI_05589 [Sesbania bispinosa]|nr:hypothetical protein SESBI_05589 [Sesbania bispinosa]
MPSRGEDLSNEVRVGVVVSTVTELGRREETTPLGSRRMERTSEGWPSMVKTTPRDLVRWEGEGERVAPWDI